MTHLKFKPTIAISLFVLVVAIISCTSETEPAPDTCSGTISLQANVLSNTNCGQQDGSFEVIASGGTGDYSFSLNGGAAQAMGTYNNVAAGAYRVKVTDEEGCSAEITVNINNEDGVNASIANVTNSACDETNGSIAIDATQGATPYAFKLDDGQFQASGTFSNLAPGNYAITVRDDNGCEVSLQAQVKSDVLFTEVKTIIQTNCAVSGCHNGSQFPDLRVDANIASNASRIRTRTSAQTMPPPSSGRELSAEEIANIACWVNDGADINR